MRVGGLAPPLFATATTPGARAAPLSTFQRMSQYRLSQQRLTDIRRNVLDIQKILSSSSMSARSQGSSVTLTGAALGLDGVGVASIVTSTQQVNAAATSIGDRTPDWTGASTAQITLDGTWDGTSDDTLRFVPSRDRDIPTSKGVKIEVYNGAGDRIDNIQVGNDYTPGDELALSNGMTMTLASGFLEQDDKATINVHASVGSALARDKPFNGIGDNDAILEDGFPVSTGSFTINGSEIVVNAADALDDVLDRINSAGLGVTAAYDEGTEQATITADAVGPTAITLANDTSGLLAALKLGGATTSVGSDPEPVQVLANLAAFSTVTTGIVTVNGVDVAIDPSQDTLEDVIAALSNVDGVSASFDGGQVSVTGEAGVTLEISDTSGLLSVLDIAVGTHAATQSLRGLSRQRAREVSALIHELSAAVGALLTDQLPGSSAATGITRLRAGIQTEFASVFEADGNRVTALGGIVFEFSQDRTRGVKQGSSTERRLAKLLDGGDTETFDALLGHGDEVGLLERLDDYTRGNLAGIRDTLRLGSRVDVLA